MWSNSYKSIFKSQDIPVKFAREILGNLIAVDKGLKPAYMWDKTFSTVEQITKILVDLKVNFKGNISK